MELILGIAQAEPGDTLNTMKNLGLEFDLVSNETNFENAHSEVTIDINISAEAFVALTKYSWPGNVRELYNVIQRARLLCSNNEILATDLIFDSPGFGSEVNTADMLAARFATDFEQEIS